MPSGYVRPMTIRSAVALAPFLLLAGAVPAAAGPAEPVEPLSGAMLAGEIQFPRAQGMIIETGTGSRLTGSGRATGWR